MQQTNTGLLLSDDLIFTSRITSTAQSLDLSMVPVRSQRELIQSVETQPPGCIILDLANPGLDVAALIKIIKAGCDPRPFVVAYGSHVDAATLKNAREAGCDLVLPRSKFVEDLPKSLPEWCGARFGGD